MAFARLAPLVTAAALAIAPIALARQEPPAKPSLTGTWTLNLEESSASSDVVRTAPLPPPPDAAPRPVGPGTATDGAGRGPQFRDPSQDGSLIPPTLGGSGTPPAPPKDKGRALSKDEKLLLELTTPPTTLALTASAAAVSIKCGGRSEIFATDGREEKHRFVNGTVKVRTTWADGKLRQELDATRDLKLIRTLEVDDHGRLIILTRPADDQSIEFDSTLISRAGAAAGKGRKRAVYDPAVR